MNRNFERGFTLAELLITVAIIGVLVAVSIPIFSSQGKKAKAASDTANVRSAKSAAISDYMLKEHTAEAVVYYYDAAKGTVTADAETAKSIIGYGKSKEDIDDHASGIPNANGKAGIVSVTVQTDGTSVCTWYGNGSDQSDPGNDAAWDQNYDYAYTEFQSGKIYKYGDIVEKGGVLYMCVNPENTDNPYFDPGQYNESSLITWRAIGSSDRTAVKYSINNRYAAGTLVSYNGKTYMFTPSYNDPQYSNNYPGSSNEQWTEITEGSTAVKPPAVSVPSSEIELLNSASSCKKGHYYVENGIVYQYGGADGTKSEIDYQSVDDNTWIQVSAVYLNQNAKYSAGDKIWYKGSYYTAKSTFTTYSGGQFEPDFHGTEYWEKVLQ
ncbi:MAG: type II secretion system protein [Erysipelotrichia bacterium]|nr:type II secretion system protein [Erysipelotrichia bacterium]